MHLSIRRAFTFPLPDAYCITILGKIMWAKQTDFKN